MADTVVAAAERTLPHNLEAERSILGAILVHNDAFNLAAQVVDSRDFYREAHRRIFARMVELNERGQAIDFVTLKEELVRNGELDEVGGPAYIASLADGVPRATNVEYYARIVKEKVDAAESDLRSEQDPDECVRSRPGLRPDSRRGRERHLRRRRRSAEGWLHADGRSRARELSQDRAAFRAQTAGHGHAHGVRRPRRE